MTTTQQDEHDAYYWYSEPPEARARAPLLRAHREPTLFAAFIESSSVLSVTRLAISPLLCDITEIEKITHVILSNGDVVGFKGHVKTQERRLACDAAALRGTPSSFLPVAMVRLKQE
ncbi:hypothetical protein RI054_10g52840 [Pseudoscourfieldia marina]